MTAHGFQIFETLRFSYTTCSKKSFNPSKSTFYDCNAQKLCDSQFWSTLITEPRQIMNGSQSAMNSNQMLCCFKNIKNNKITVSPCVIVTKMSFLRGYQFLHMQIYCFFKNSSVAGGKFLCPRIHDSTQTNVHKLKQHV